MLNEVVTSTAGAQLGPVQALILGIVEGITEFLPVSSTAHLDLARQVMKLEATDYMKSFEIIIQLGAILSVVVLYWKKFWNWELLMKLAVAFLPTGILGFAFRNTIKAHLLGNVAVMLSALIIGGVLLIVFEFYHARTENEVDFSEITYKRAFLIGIFQSIAMIPGTSRSAATIVGGSMLGVSKRTIVEFSFMLAVPTMAAATGYELLKDYKSLSVDFGSLAIGFVVSFITAIIAIKSFLAFVKKRAFSVFGVYRIVLAIAFYFFFVR
jgi:undecaprenyl-diphosphatase